MDELSMDVNEDEKPMDIVWELETNFYRIASEILERLHFLGFVGVLSQVMESTWLFSGF